MCINMCMLYIDTASEPLTESNKEINASPLYSERNLQHHGFKKAFKF